MNEMITVKEVRCTSDEGTNYGIIKYSRSSIKLADEYGLRLSINCPRCRNLLLLKLWIMVNLDTNKKKRKEAKKIKK